MISVMRLEPTPTPPRAAAAPGRAPLSPHQVALAQALAAVPLFATLGAEHLARLARAVTHRTYEPGQVLMLQGEPGQTLEALLWGEVEVSLTSPAGQEIVLAALGPGDVLGELALLDGGPRSATVTAVRRTETLSLHREDFLAVVHQAPEVAMRLLGVLAARLQATEYLLAEALSLDVGGRLARKLLDLGATRGRRTPRGIAIEPTLTQEALARLIGTTRESVNKQLGRLRAYGVIARDGHRLILLRPEALAACARLRPAGRQRTTRAR